MAKHAKKATRRRGKGCGHKIGGRRWCCRTIRVKAFGRRKKITRAYCSKAAKA